MKKSPLGIIGFGNFAKAWALNLRDSGRNVQILLRDQSPSRDSAQKMDFPVFTIQEFFAEASSSQILELAVLVPDDQQKNVIEELAKERKDNLILYYPHGWALLNAQLAENFPQFHHVLFAPKAIGRELRFQYEIGNYSAAVYSLEKLSTANRDRIKEPMLVLAKDLGIGVGPFEVTVAQETMADLFSEQSLLCGLIPEAAMQSFQLLRQKGIPPELAYLECWYELSLVVSVMVEQGPEQFFKSISPNASLGAKKAAPLFSKPLKKVFESLWNDIESGQFSKELLNQDDQSGPRESEEFHELHKRMKSYFRPKKGRKNESQALENQQT